MVSTKKIGKLVQKYMRVEPEVLPGGESFQEKKRRAGLRTSSSSGVSSRSSSSHYWDAADDDHDDEGEDAPADVPEGCLAVYVGDEMRRFVIQTEFLYKRVFRELLRKSEEEYGFETSGGLRIACEAGLFEQLLWQLETGGYADDDSF